MSLKADGRKKKTVPVGPTGENPTQPGKFETRVCARDGLKESHREGIYLIREQAPAKSATRKSNVEEIGGPRPAHLTSKPWRKAQGPLDWVRRSMNGGGGGEGDRIHSCLQFAARRGRP